jgi:hypothetical protein
MYLTFIGPIIVLIYSPLTLQPVPAVQTAVTRLLVATKQLLETLTQWSQGKSTENDVSDVYVRMGNDFNSAVAAFQACGIDMSYV